MSHSAKSRYFDTRAESWGNHGDRTALAHLLDTGICNFGVRDDEVVVDLGCGTGVLTEALLRRLSARGRVVAVDFAPRMLTRARNSIPDGRVTWLCNDARQISAREQSVDRVIAFSAWPHFDHPELVITEIRRVLRRNGKLHIWHRGARHRINAIHSRCGNPVAGDTLRPAHELAQVLATHGFVVYESIDDEERYLISAARC